MRHRVLRLVSGRVPEAGTAPEFAYTYAVQPNGNTTLLSSGATIQLPLTMVSVISFVLAAFKMESKRSAEAALKSETKGRFPGCAA